MGCRSHALGKSKINALSVVEFCWHESRRGKQRNCSSEKAIVELLQAVVAAPGLHWPLSQEPGLKMQLFCPAAAALVFLDGFPHTSLMVG